MRLAFFALTTLLFTACASGPAKLPSCDGSNLRPINPGYPTAEAAPTVKVQKTGAAITSTKQP